MESHKCHVGTGQMGNCPPDFQDLVMNTKKLDEVVLFSKLLFYGSGWILALLLLLFSFGTVKLKVKYLHVKNKKMRTKNFWDPESVH